MPWCKSCGESNFWRNGKNEAGQQIRKCRKCGFRFVWTSDLPDRKFFSCVINFAVELYTSVIGISYRKVAVVMKKLGFKMSHQAVKDWVSQDKTKNFVDDKVDNAQTWHCDETHIKIKGVGHWLWVIYCRETGQVLGWHISLTRLLKDAIIVFQKAKKAVNGKRPEKIITDGLWQYNVAIKKVIGWHWMEQKRKYIIDSGIGKNSFVERVNKEIKRRTKWFGSFQAIEGANSFFKLFFNNFNKRRALAPNTG